MYVIDAYDFDLFCLYAILKLSGRVHALLSFRLHVYIKRSLPFSIK